VNSAAEQAPPFVPESDCERETETKTAEVDSELDANALALVAGNKVHISFAGIHESL